MNIFFGILLLFWCWLGGSTFGYFKCDHWEELSAGQRYGLYVIGGPGVWVWFVLELIFDHVLKPLALALWSYLGTIGPNQNKE